MRYSNIQKVLSIILCIVMVMGLLPAMAGTALAADEATPLQGQRVADPSTLNEWENYFGPNVLSTEFAGGVWTDKSVFTDASAFRAQIAMNDPQNNFLVSLSAIAANKTITGYSSTPFDVMLVLDVSGSMSNNDKDEAMIEAANITIDSLLKQNQSNRIGVVLYSGSGSTSSNATTGSATVILPLDRYTTTSNSWVSNNGRWEQIPAYLSLSGSSVSIPSGVRNGNNTRPTGSKNVSGGTYIQNGLYRAWNEFAAVEDTVIPAGQPHAGSRRTPIMILMSDGQPTHATASYNNVGSSERTYGTGAESSTTWRTVFLTQLTAAWVKGKMQAHYKTTPKFYTVGLGTGTSNYATSVLNPSSTSSDLNGYWNNFNNNQPDEDGYVRISNNWELYKDSNVENRYYSDLYLLAEDSDQLQGAFQNIVHEIELEAAKHVTLVEDKGEDFSGYITFTDELGVMMEVKQMKGIVLGTQLFTGEELAKSLGSDEMGTQGNPTEYGNEFIRTVRQRLGIENTSDAQVLVNAAYSDGQLFYNAQTGEYSNYIGWYSNNAGDYLGFWDKDTGITAVGAPAGATWINKSYGYLGVAGSSDMMHVVVMLSTHIETGMQVIQFKIPASLIPMVLYDVELDGADVTQMKEITRTGADPMRLVYEVGLRSDLNTVNLEDKLEQMPESLHVHENSDGSYSFYTNMWGSENGDHEVDYNDPLGHQVAQSHFNPSVGNDRYYYTEDTPVYLKQGDAYILYNGNSAPSGTGYYRAYHYYTAQGYTTTYLPMSEYALGMAAGYGRQDDGHWYIPQGAIFQQIDRFHMKKSENKTGSLEYYDYPVVLKTQDHYEVYAFLGNNGKITVESEQGIALTKTVTEVVAGAPETFTFHIKLSQAVENPIVTDPEGDPITGNWSVSGDTITVELKADETVCITGIPTGVSYTVTEEESKYYHAVSDNASGTVQAHTIHKVNFVNEPKGYGNLIISKDVDHPFDVIPEALTQKEFTIHVQLTGEDVAGKTFAATGNNVTSVTTDDSGRFTVTLKDNESITVLELPEGTEFVTTETLDAVAHKGFSLDAARSTLTGTVVKDQTAQAHVINVYKPAAAPTALNVAGTKQLQDEAGAFDWEGKSFTIELQQYNPQTGVYTTVAETSVSKDNLSYKFEDLLKFDTLGTYYFKVMEVIPEQRLEGMSYDATVGRFAVTVTDTDVDGQLEYVVTNADTNQVLTPVDNVYTFNKNFVNIHSTDATYVEFTVDKDVVDPHGIGATEAGYLFELFEVHNGVTSASPTYSMRTVLVDGEGQAKFHIPVTKVGVQTFVLKEAVPVEKIPGMNYDDSQFTVVVTTTAEEGKLVSSVSFLKDGEQIAEEDLVFTNTIKLEPVVLNPHVVKELIGREPKNDREFTFQIQQTDGSFTTAMEGGYSDTVSIGEGTAYFKTITVTKAGTYYYRVTEIPGNAGGMTYDNSIYHITVTVTAENDKLVSNVSYVKVGEGVPSASADTVKFTNTYVNNDTAEVVLTGTKNLIGRDSVTGEFQFLLTGENGYSQTTGNRADGTFVFDPIIFTADDIGDHTFTYHIAELNSGKGGVTYDTTEHTVTITVRDNGNGELETVVTGADDLVFNNTYTTTPVDVSFSGTKNWYNTDTNSQKAMEGGEFTFVLMSTDSGYTTEGQQVATVTNRADGTFGFNLHYTRPGTYYYLLREQIGTNPGVNYDTGTYQIRVDVFDNANGALIGHVERIYKVGTGSDQIIFSNRYTPQPTQVEINGLKVLNGRPLLDGEFEYQIFAADSSFAVTGQALQTVTNVDEEFRFDPIEFTSSGTYYYVVKETVPAEAVNNVYDGVRYDTSVYGITVTVTDDGKGELSATYTVTKNGTEAKLVFTNEYTVTDYTSFQISGKKTLTGKTLEDGMFTFEIVDANGVRISIATNDANGNFAFVNVPLTSVGEHTFTIREVDDGKGGITYDKTEYTVKVVAADNLSGGLIASLPVVTRNGAEAQVVFTNTYKAEPTSAQFRGQKIMEGRQLKADQFSFELVDAQGNVVQTASNLAGGGFLFDEITYDQPGTYTYTIREVIPAGAVNNKLDGVTYDDHICTAIATVTDNGDGTMDAEVRYEGLPRFTNTYEVTGPVFVDIAGTKVLTGKTLQADMFTFELYKDGKKIGTAANKADGSFLFEDVELNSLGEHTFTVVETKGKLGGITYDTKEYSVSVTVMDNGKGGMQASVPVVTYNGAIAELVFTNTYAVTQPTQIDISGVKTLEGVKALTSGMFTFELYKDGQLVDSVNNVGQNFTFKNVKLDTLGEHTFTVKEKIPADAVDNVKNGITYDTKEYTVTVEVADNGEGGMTAAQPELWLGVVPVEAIEFVNRYNVKGTTVDISGKKTLTGKKLEDNMFAFELVKDGEVIAVTQNVGDTFTFQNIALDTLGDHQFVVRELIPAEAVGNVHNGVSYQDAEYVVNVSLTTSDDGKGGMVVSEPTYEKNGQSVTEPAFTNVYTVTGPAKLTLSGSKTFTGKDLKDGLFTFEMYEGDKLIGTATNVGANFTFTDVELEGLGEHILTVKEKIPADAAENKKDGITYDTTVYTVTVNVVDDGKGGMEALTPVITAAGADAQLNFVNSFEVEPVSVIMKVKKTVVNKGEAIMGPEDFYFALYLNGEKMKQVASDAEGNAQFEVIFTKEALNTGTFEFEVREVNTGKTGVIYSDVVYKVTAIVTENELGLLDVQMQVDGTDVDTVELGFENTFDPPATPTTGDTTNTTLLIVSMGISGTAILVLLAVLVLDSKKKKNA